MTPNATPPPPSPACRARGPGLQPRVPGPGGAPKRPVSVLVVVHTRAGEVLLLRRRQPAGFWQSVTGSLEWGEMPSKAARRELYEETGIVAIPRYTRITHRFPIAPAWRRRYAAHNRYNREHVFELTLPHRVHVRLDPAEHLELRWLPWRRAAACATSWTDRLSIRALAGGVS
jgi:dihydroneopterin triphosphate diphosphatase